jgi:dipeptidyl aminopeptidase/acylaminoacyl peptidase
MKFINFTLGLLLTVLLFSCTEVNNTTNEAEPAFDVQLTEIEKSGGILTPEILWKFGRVGEFALSPDGKNTVYSISYYDVPTNKRKTNLYLVGTEGGEPIALTEGLGANFNPRWIKNGKKIAYISTKSGETQLWEMKADGTMPKQISFIEGGINSFEYSPDGTHILYTKDVKLDKKPNEIYPDLPNVDVRMIDDLMYNHWNQWHDYAYSHIFVASYTHEKLENDIDIMEGELWDAPLSAYFDASEMTWSPDGKMIAYTCKKLKGKEYAVSTNSDIFLYDLEKKTTENLTEGMMGYDKYPVFSPDSKKIAWQSMETPGYEADKDRMFVLDLESKEKEYITKDFDQDVSNMIWSDDGKIVYFLSGINASFHIYSYNFDQKAFNQITDGQYKINGFAKVENTIIGTKQTSSLATEIFKFDLNTGENTQLTFTNKHIYEHVKMGEAEERWIKTTDGKDMMVLVIYPPNFDANKEYPALLYCKGGPQGPLTHNFHYRWNYQIMAANDYIVVAPARRGTSSFGKEWKAQISGDYGGQNIDDYLSAIDALAEEPFIDKERLGAIGASYGGYSVFWLAGHHEGRFKTFISHCGIYNFESMYTTTEEMFFVHHDYGGAYWDFENKKAQKSYTFSPHKYVQNWDTPILIITGGYDLRIPYTQSFEAFGAAQMRGIESKILFFPNETHFVVKPQNAILWQREFFGWLDKSLK